MKPQVFVVRVIEQSFDPLDGGVTVKAADGPVELTWEGWDEDNLPKLGERIEVIAREWKP